MSNVSAIEVEKLTKVYGHGNTEVVALREVTLRVRRGEVVALVGPSGSGKSTLLTCMGLINLPTSGRVRIGGQLVIDGSRALADLRAFRRQHLGFVFQKSNLVPFLTARENVQITLENNGLGPSVAKRKALALLDYFGMANRAGHYPAMLSGGQQQRVAVARALANQPNVILADEPTAALDSQRGRQVMDLFRQVAREKDTAVVVVTHDHRALDVCDTTYEMQDGIIQQVRSGEAAMARRAIEGE